jgi:hypothetical protein
MWISKSLVEKVKSIPKLSEVIDIQDDPRDMQFDVLGTLAR